MQNNCSETTKKKVVERMVGASSRFQKMVNEFDEIHELVSKGRLDLRSEKHRLKQQIVAEIEDYKQNPVVWEMREIDLDSTNHRKQEPVFKELALATA